MTNKEKALLMVAANASATGDTVVNMHMLADTIAANLEAAEINLLDALESYLEGLDTDPDTAYYMYNLMKRFIKERENAR